MISGPRISSLIAVLFRKPPGLCALLLTALLTGCATSGAVKQIDKLASVDDSATFLVMTPDIKYYLLTASGVPELEPEWTDSARTHFAQALQNFADERHFEIKNLPDQANLTELEISYQKLYSAVGSTILSHHYGPVKLPTKKGVFDWTLGPGVAEIGRNYDADYALFTYYREYQASGGRLALSFFAALMGVGLATGGEIGFASLIDLRSGEVVWFNKMPSGIGELRDPENAEKTVANLFKNIPLNE